MGRQLADARLLIPGEALEIVEHRMVRMAGGAGDHGVIGGRQILAQASVAELAAHLRPADIRDPLTADLHRVVTQIEAKCITQLRQVVDQVAARDLLPACFRGAAGAGGGGSPRSVPSAPSHGGGSSGGRPGLSGWLTPAPVAPPGGAAGTGSVRSALRSSGSPHSAPSVASAGGGSVGVAACSASRALRYGRASSRRARSSGHPLPSQL